MEFFFGENFAHVANFFPQMMKTLTRDEKL